MTKREWFDRINATKTVVNDNSLNAYANHLDMKWLSGAIDVVEFIVRNTFDRSDYCVTVSQEAGSVPL
jgi:hypothetical protein